MTSNAPPAPSSSPLYFAASFSRAELGEALILDIRRMVECIREQQAALAALCDVANNAQCLHELEQARAVLAKWHIE